MLMVTAFRLVKCLLWIWRFKTMANKAMNVAKGIGMGVRGRGQQQGDEQRP